MAKKDNIGENASVIGGQTEVGPRVEKAGMGKPDGSFTKSTTSEKFFSNASGKVVNKVIERIDLDSLSNTLADQLANKLAVSIHVDSLIATVFDNSKEALQKSLTDAIFVEVYGTENP